MEPCTGALIFLYLLMQNNQVTQLHQENKELRERVSFVEQVVVDNAFDLKELKVNGKEYTILDKKPTKHKGKLVETWE